MSFAGNATPSDQKGYTTLLFLLLPPDAKNEARRGYCGGGCYQAISCRGPDELETHMALKCFGILYTYYI